MRSILTKCLFLGALALSAVPHLSFAETKRQTEMLHHLNGIQHIFEAQYAPIEWKKEYVDWDLDFEFEKAKDVIIANPNMTIKDYQRLVRGVLNGTQDYHVGISFHSTEKAILPFQVKGVNGQYFITAIDYSRLSKDYYLEVGDELISFNGRSTDEVVQELKQSEFGKGETETDQSLAEMVLTRRSGAAGQIVPKGSVTVKTRPSGSSKMKTYQLVWNYAPEKISNAAFSKGEPDINQPISFRNKEARKHQMLSPKVTDLGFFKVKGEDDEDDDESTDSVNPNAIGTKKSFIPSLGQKIWESDPKYPFYAYVFLNDDGKKIGYVRIPDYAPLDEENYAKAFAGLIGLMQKHTEALVIDQVNNPGGSVFYMYALASMLNDEPMRTPQHRMMITQEDVAEALDVLEMLDGVDSNESAQNVLGETLSGYPVNYQVAQFIQNFSTFIIGEWTAGRRFTQPHYLWGVDQINPYPWATYTKPILLVINELDFSCGDFFPAILQDNKRVTTFGTETAGAGGYVRGFGSVNRFGVRGVRLTGSIAQRDNQRFIENHGVTPDISYKLSASDIVDGYQDYKNALLEALDGMLLDGEIPQPENAPVLINQ